MPKQKSKTKIKGKSKVKQIEDKLLEGAEAVVDFFQPADNDRDVMDFVGDQTNKNRKPPFNLI